MYLNDTLTATLSNGKKSERPLHIRWGIGYSCNYRCGYCINQHSPSQLHWYSWRHLVRDPLYLSVMLAGRNHVDAFENRPPSVWLRAFERIAPRPFTLTISGGEPFLRTNDMRALLQGFSAMDHILAVTILTNGDWDAKPFQGLNWKKFSLVISYHPTQTTLGAFRRRIAVLLDMRVDITMVNCVMNEDTASDFFELKAAMDELGVFTNADVLVEVKAYSHTPEYEAICRAHMPELDLNMKTGLTCPKGRLCAYPTFAFDIHATGHAHVECFPKRLVDFLAGELPRLFHTPPPCPVSRCTCPERYAFLLEHVGRGHALSPFKEYTHACRMHRLTVKGLDFVGAGSGSRTRTEGKSAGF